MAASSRDLQLAALSAPSSRETEWFFRAPDGRRASAKHQLWVSARAAVAIELGVEPQSLELMVREA